MRGREAVFEVVITDSCRGIELRRQRPGRRAMALTKAGDGRRKWSWNTAQVLEEGRDVHAGRKHQEEAMAKVRNMSVMQHTFGNVPLSEFRCAKEEEERKHDHEECMRSERGGIHEVCVQDRVPDV